MDVLQRRRATRLPAETVPRGLATGSRAAVVAAFLASCSLPGTGGELVEVEWVVHGLTEENPVVVQTSDEGSSWEVELTEATLLVGPVYAFEPPPASSSTTASRFDLRDLFGPSRAFAHAGDDNTDGIRVVSELLQQEAVDLLDPTDVLEARTLAEAGPIGTLNVLLDEARFDYASPDGPTRGGHAFLRGIARRRSGSAGGIDGGTAEDGDADDVVRFTAVLRSTVPDDRIARRVESLPVGGGALAEGSTIEVTVDPRAWVRQMNFDALLDEASKGPFGDDGDLVVEEPSQLHNAWYLGLRDPRGWTAEVVAPPQ